MLVELARFLGSYSLTRRAIFQIHHHRVLLGERLQGELARTLRLLE